MFGVFACSSFNPPSHQRKRTDDAFGRQLGRLGLAARAAVARHGKLLPIAAVAQAREHTLRYNTKVATSFGRTKNTKKTQQNASAESALRLPNR